MAETNTILYRNYPPIKQTNKHTQTKKVKVLAKTLNQCNKARFRVLEVGVSGVGHYDWTPTLDRKGSKRQLLFLPGNRV